MSSLLFALCLLQSGQPATGSEGPVWRWTPSHFVAPSPAEPERKWHGEPISLSLKEADLREVLRSFAKLSELNLVLDPKVQGKVTVELHNVPWDQALSLILKTHRLGLVVDGRLWTADRLENIGRP